METNSQHKSMAMTLCIVNKIYPSIILNHSFLNYQLKNKFLKKIGQKMLKIEKGLENTLVHLYLRVLQGRASENFDISSANYCSPYMPIIFVMEKYIF